MTVDKFILAKPLLDFFFKPKGKYKTLYCGNFKDGVFDISKTLVFDDKNKIQSEIGYQQGWTAYPPGTSLPPPNKYLRNYTYNQEQLTLVSELDFNSKKLLKSYELNYVHQHLLEIIETAENDKKDSSKRIRFEYDKEGHLIRKSIDRPSFRETKNHLIFEIQRNEKNQIVKIVRSSITESNGKEILSQEQSIKDIAYENDEIKMQVAYPNQDKIISITAQLLHSNSELIQSITYGGEFEDQKISFEYDNNTQDLLKKTVTHKDRVITKTYKYEGM